MRSPGKMHSNCAVRSVRKTLGNSSAPGRCSAAFATSLGETTRIAYAFSRMNRTGDAHRSTSAMTGQLINGLNRQMGCTTGTGSQHLIIGAWVAMLLAFPPRCDDLHVLCHVRMRNLEMTRPVRRFRKGEDGLNTSTSFPYAIILLPSTKTMSLPMRQALRTISCPRS